MAEQRFVIHWQGKSGKVRSCFPLRLRRLEAEAELKDLQRRLGDFIDFWIAPATAIDRKWIDDKPSAIWYRMQ